MICGNYNNVLSWIQDQQSLVRTQSTSPLDCRNRKCSICTKDVCRSVARKEHPIYRLFQNASKLYATALAIEVLCICAAEIGENRFAIFGYRSPGC